LSQHFNLNVWLVLSAVMDEDIDSKLKEKLFDLFKSKVSVLSSLENEKLVQRKRELEEELENHKKVEFNNEDAYEFLARGVKDLLISSQIKYCDLVLAKSKSEVRSEDSNGQQLEKNNNNNISSSENQEQEEEEEEKSHEWGNMVEGEWKQGTAGGCLNEATWRQNEQFFLKVESSGTVELTLEQLGEDEIHPIGFYIFEGVNNKKIVLSPNTLAKSSFKRAESVTCSFNCEPNTNGYVRIL
jgi:hypothetical protein